MGAQDPQSCAGRSASTSARSRSTRPSRRPGPALPRPDRAVFQRRPRPRAGAAGAARGGARPPAQAQRSVGLPRLRRLLRHRASERPDRAVAELRAGLRLAPDNVDLLGRSRSTSESWAAGTARRPGSRAPRCWTPARRARALSWPTCARLLRHYAAADSAADRAVALAPTSPRVVAEGDGRASARGDLDSARAVIRAGARQIDPDALFPFFASYKDLYWVLDDAQQRQVLASPPSAFDDDRGIWGIVRAQLYHLRGDRVRARALCRLGAARVRGAGPGGARRRAAPRAPRPGPGVSGAEGGRGARRPAGGGADADQPGRQPRPLHPAPARADLPAGRRAGAGAGPARAAAPDPVLPLARHGSGSIPPSIRCGATRGSGSWWRERRERPARRRKPCPANPTTRSERPEQLVQTHRERRAGAGGMPAQRFALDRGKVVGRRPDLHYAGVGVRHPIQGHAGVGGT